MVGEVDIQHGAFVDNHDVLGDLYLLSAIYSGPYSAVDCRCFVRCRLVQTPPGQSGGRQKGNLIFLDFQLFENFQN